MICSKCSKEFIGADGEQSRIAIALGLTLCMNCWQDAFYGSLRSDPITNVAQLGEDGKLLSSQAPPGGSGDMLASVYDPIINGKTTLSAVKEDADIANAISKKHANTLDHSNNLDHSNSLDHSGSTQDTAIAGKEAANANIQTHVTSAHAPSTAQKNSDITKAEIEAKLTGELTSHSHAGGGSPPAWKGAIAAAWDDGAPADLLDMMLNNPINATPTNIAITVARCAFFTLDTQLIVNKIRFFGVGALTNVYRVAIYRLSDLVRLTAELPFTTVAQAWGAAGAALNLTLLANTIYFIAVAVNATGTTAGVQCMSSTTGRIGVLPTNWPGNLKINLVPPKIGGTGFCQFAVTAGALPNPANTLALQGAWTGGMPAFFLDNSNL